MKLVWIIAIVLLVLSISELAFKQNKAETVQLKEVNMQPCNGHWPYKQCEDDH